MAQQDKIGKHKTTIYDENNFTCVKYWWTDIVKFSDQEIILNSGGYKTATTKTRMNQASNQFNLGFQVFQRNYIWYVNFKDYTMQFKDFLVLYR